HLPFGEFGAAELILEWIVADELRGPPVRLLRATLALEEGDADELLLPRAQHVEAVKSRYLLQDREESLLDPGSELLDLALGERPAFGCVPPGGRVHRSLPMPGS